MNRRKNRRQKIAVAMALCLILVSFLPMLPSRVSAQELSGNSVQGQGISANTTVSDGSVSQNGLKLITDLKPLDPLVAEQYIPLNSAEDAVVFPSLLEGTVDGSDAQIPAARWNMTQSSTEGVFDTSVLGNWFIYTPEFPADYELADGVSAEWCNILVTVGDRSDLARSALIDSLYSWADTSWYDADPNAAEFTISSAAQMFGLSKITNTYYPWVNFSGKKIQLKADIDFSGRDWIPVSAVDDKPFMGTFYGNGHTVSGIRSYSDICTYIESLPGYQPVTPLEYVYQCFGVFGRTGTMAQIIDLGVKDGSIDFAGVRASSGRTYAGGIAGRNDGYILNCYNTMDLSITTDNIALREYGASVGGIAGENIGGRIVNCYNTGVIKGGNRAGGLVGMDEKGAVRNCFNRGAVSPANPSVETAIGGIVGSKYIGKIDNCYNAGVIGQAKASGGIIGLSSGNQPIISIYWREGTAECGIGAYRDGEVYTFFDDQTDPIRAYRMQEAQMKLPLSDGSGLGRLLNIYIDQHGNVTMMGWTVGPDKNDGYPFFGSMGWPGTGGASHSITGIFSGAPTGAGLTVNLYNGTGALVAQTVTGADGSYVFSGVPDNTYYIMGAARDKSYGGGSGFFVLSGADVTKDISVGPLVAGGVIKGSGGTGIPGAQVDVSNGAGAGGTAVTDQDGNYYLYGNLPDGDYAVQVSKGGTALGGGSLTVQGGVSGGFSIGTVTGVLKDQGGTGLGGVKVTLTASGGQSYTGVTDANGGFRIDGVPDGSYTVSFVKGDGSGGITYGSGSAVIKNGVLTATGGDLSSGQGGTVTVPGVMGAVTGFIVYENGNAVAGATVVVNGPTGPVGQTVGKMDGSFLIGGLGDGSYTLNITSPDGRTVTGVISVVGGKAAVAGNGITSGQGGTVRVVFPKNDAVKQIEIGIQALPDPGAADALIEAGRNQIAGIKGGFDALTYAEKGQVDRNLLDRLDQLIGRLDGIHLNVDDSQAGTGVDGSGMGMQVSPGEIQSSGAGNDVNVTLTVVDKKDSDEAKNAADALAGQDGKKTGNVYEVGVDKWVNGVPAPTDKDSKVTVKIELPPDIQGNGGYQAIIIGPGGAGPEYVQTTVQGNTVIFEARPGDRFVIAYNPPGTGGGNGNGGPGGDSGGGNGGGGTGDSGGTSSQGGSGGSGMSGSGSQTGTSGVDGGKIAGMNLPTGAPGTFGAAGATNGALPGAGGLLDDTPRTEDPAPIMPVMWLGIVAFMLTFFLRDEKKAYSALFPEETKDRMVRAVMEQTKGTALSRRVAVMRIAVILFVYHLVRIAESTPHTSGGLKGGEI